jgi:ankyrin repeat protein
LRKNNTNKIKSQKNETNSIFKKRFINEAYNQMRSEIDNYKTSQLNKQNSLKFNNYKKFLEIKKIYDTEKDKKEKEIENNRIIGIKRAYEKIKGKFEEKKQKMGKNLLLTEAKLNIADNKNLISLPKLHLNIQNVYSRLYKNAVIIPPSNSRGKNQLGQLKRQLTQDKIRPKAKIKFSLKNALSTNNGKEYTMNVTEDTINTCFIKYSGGPANQTQIKNIEEKKGETSKEFNHINFYDLEEKKTGNSYLHSAIIDNHTELVRYILEKNADINKQNNNGDTPLHLALKSGNMEIIKLIMNKKPALNIPNKEGIIPLNLFTIQMKVYFNIDKLSFDNNKK